jgi:hypothetical protein
MSPDASQGHFTKGKQPKLTDAVVMRWHQTVINMYGVSEPSLNEMIAGYNSVYSVFFGICVGAAISLGLTIKTISLGGDYKRYCFDAFLVTIGLSFFFGIAFVNNLVRAILCKKRLYKEAIPITGPSKD